MSFRGVIGFKGAAYVHAYMTHAYRMPHFACAYAPRGTIDAVEPPD